MEEKLIKIEEKLDKIEERLGSMDVTLAKQEINLQEHMRRSLANEQAVEILANEFKPVQTHVATMNNIFKAVGVLATFLSFVGAVIKAFF